MANGDVLVQILVSGTLASGEALAPFSKVKTFSSIADILDRTITVPTSEVTVLQVGATVAGATLSSLNCCIIYNLDSTNFLTVGIKVAGSKSAYYKIEAGEFMVFTARSMDVDDDAGGAFGSFSDIDTLTLQANTAAVKARMVAF